MTRARTSTWAVGTLCVCLGCSRGTPDAPTAATSEAPATSQVEPLPLSEEAIAEAKPIDAATQANKRVELLAREINGHRRRGYGDQATAARAEMVAVLEKSCGVDSWQAHSARLALARETRLEKFSPAEQAANEGGEARARESYELWRRGEREAALTRLVEARRIATQVWGEETYGVANLLDQEARWRQAVGELPAAEQLFRRALAIRTQVFTTRHPETTATTHALGLLLQADGKPGEAEVLLRQTVDQAALLWGDTHPEYAANLNDLALLLLEKGDYRHAIDLFSQVVEIRRRALGEKHELVGQAQLNLGRAWYAVPDYDRAAAPMRAALEILEATLGAEHASTRQARISLGLTEMAQRDYPGAESLLRADYEISRRQGGDDQPDAAEGLVRLAILYGNQGRYAEALPLVERAVAIHRAKTGTQHAATLNAEMIAARVREGLARTANRSTVNAASGQAPTSGGVRTSFEQPLAR